MRRFERWQKRLWFLSGCYALIRLSINYQISFNHKNNINMQAKDLRKGNIVKNDKLDIFKSGYIILEARDIYNLAVFESGQTVDEEHKCFEPIKLTVQWLYEFGFKADTDETDEFILNGFRIYKIRENLEFANHDFPIKLEFIHQLQNLFFALTGSELVYSA